MELMTLPLKRYAEFAGRSRRKEFWMFFLLVIIASIVASTLDRLLGLGSTNTLVSPSGGIMTTRSNGPISILVSLGLLVPNIAVAIRRLHDTDRSGWWLLLSFVPILGWIALLIFYCQEGTRGPNQFGADPKSEHLGEVFR